jgi:outer membrane lipoprotein-sorting protein
MKTALAGLCLAVFSASLNADSALDAILARMDKASPNFHGMSAKVDMVEYQKILNDSTNDKGSLQMQRKGKEVRAVLTFPDRWIGFLGKVVRVYWPQLNTYQDYDIGKDLAQSYNITLGGNENVAGQNVSRLVLIPKDPKVQERLTKIEVWIPADGANPVQQQFYEPSGNWRKVTYSNIQLNPAIPGTLEIKLPPGAKRQS